MLIPGLNDSTKEITKLVNWIVENIGLEIPLHFTAFYPTYKLSNLPTTSIATLRKARKIAFGKGLKYVYTGNLPDDEGNNTYCPKCKRLLVKRNMFSITENNIKQGRCFNCHSKIEGFWDY